MSQLTFYLDAWEVPCCWRAGILKLCGWNLGSNWLCLFPVLLSVELVLSLAGRGGVGTEDKLCPDSRAKSLKALSIGCRDTSWALSEGDIIWGPAAPVWDIAMGLKFWRRFCRTRSIKISSSAMSRAFLWLAADSWAILAGWGKFGWEFGTNGRGGTVSNWGGRGREGGVEICPWPLSFTSFWSTVSFAECLFARSTLVLGTACLISWCFCLCCTTLAGVLGACLDFPFELLAELGIAELGIGVREVFVFLGLALLTACCQKDPSSSSSSSSASSNMNFRMASGWGLYSHTAARYTRTHQSALSNQVEQVVHVKLYNSRLYLSFVLQQVTNLIAICSIACIIEWLSAWVT